VSFGGGGGAGRIAPPRMATAGEILEKTVYSGGGSEKSLVRISVKELQKANGGEVAEVRK